MSKMLHWVLSVDSIQDLLELLPYDSKLHELLIGHNLPGMWYWVLPQWHNRQQCMCTMHSRMLKLLLTHQMLVMLQHPIL
jgi:hypothetical protein